MGLQYKQGDGRLLHQVDGSLMDDCCCGPPDGMILWLKADAGITLSGSNVIEWLDQSPTGLIFNSAGASPPTIVNNLQNNLPSVAFNGVDEAIFGTTDFNLPAAHAIYAVLQSNSNSDGYNDTVFSMTNSITGASEIEMTILTRLDPDLRRMHRMRYPTLDTYLIGYVAESALLSIAIMAQIHLDQFNLYSWTNGALVTTYNENNGMSVVTIGMSVRMGRSTNSTQFSNFNVCELIVYPSGVVDPDVFTYLNNRWAIY